MSSTAGPSLAARIEQIDALAARAHSVLDLAIEALREAKPEPMREIDALELVAEQLREITFEVVRVRETTDAAPGRGTESADA